MSSHLGLFIGDGSLVIRCADLFLEAGQAIAAVASKDQTVLRSAQERGLKWIDLSRGSVSDVAEFSFDFLFSIAHLEVIPPDVLRRAGRLAVNFHDSLLPSYAGLNATAWALIAGERTHGVTWHEMTEEVDAGRILRQVSFGVGPDETAFSLNAKCYQAGSESFAALVEDIATGRISLQEQRGERSYFGRHYRPAVAATLDFRKPAQELAALVRGLDYGHYPNPLARPKVFTGSDVLLVGSAEIVGEDNCRIPGTVLRLEKDLLTVSTSAGGIALRGLLSADGSPLGTWEKHRVKVGDVLPELSSSVLERMASRLPDVAKLEPFWTSRLKNLTAAVLPYPRIARTPADTRPERLRLPILNGISPASLDGIVAAFLAWFSRIAGQDRVSVLYSDAELREGQKLLEPWLVRWVPLTVELDGAISTSAARDETGAELQRLRQAGPYLRDLPSRLGGGRTHDDKAIGIGVLVDEFGPGSATELFELILAINSDSRSIELIVDRRVFDEPVARLMASHFEHFLANFQKAIQSSGEAPLRELSLLPPEERAASERMNSTATAFERSRCIHHEIEAQASRTPDRTALISGSEHLSYCELDQKSNALAARLRARGVGPGSIIGLCLSRSSKLIVALLAIHKAGAAYLPLDPDYPLERIRFMIEDSNAPLVVTSQSVAKRLSLAGDQIFIVDDPAPAEGKETTLGEVQSESLAYVIYTSGSTGRPKGVKVSHRNVLNFFAGMDPCIPHDPPGRWLAVSSLSFDISVLELCWTLSRGFTVVLPSDEQEAAAAGPQFSLFYFASDEGSSGDKYRLLLEGAKFADREGFTAVWTPERHFHAFGGLYPNPAVVSAAIAATTERIAIRAGSCVLPLHHPIRVAEDWALVDAISRGRVGISFASGWQQNDFVLAPDQYATRKESMIAQIDVVRRLWRGEALPFRGPDDAIVLVRTLPRPVQKDLPVWLTAAGNPETFRQAGELGCHVLTHLLGQSIEDVAEKIRLYRAAWRKAGHAGSGHVTLMLHTFVGEDADGVRETVRAPMKAYLKSSVDLIRQAAWTFPTFVKRAAADGRSPAEIMDRQALSGEEMDALVEHAFARYYETSGLFGTPDSCLRKVEALQGIGVDEIACLIDFGLAADTVLRHLPNLKTLMDRAQSLNFAPARVSVAEEIARHRATHLQCTPSLAGMLVADEAGRSALAGLDVMMVGGEALPMDLARQLRALLPGKLLNMYGPTEATIWSSVADLDTIGDFVPLGDPIANTQLYVLNRDGQECPALAAGELYIGGEGVACGYLNSPDLTAERFAYRPFSQAEGLVYRTGDLVRRHPNGALEFLGRVDHQVKIRGHRIELGEIENALARQPGVRQTVVMARENEAGAQHLIAYVTAQPNASLDPATLRQCLARELPDVMVPAIISILPAMPLTPNGKVDRGALPVPRSSVAVTSAPPGNDIERRIAAIWAELLGLSNVGISDNFFDLGGHSLLVVQVQRRLKEDIGREIAITDMFRYATIQSLAAHIGGVATDRTVEKGLDRASVRKAMIMRRQKSPMHVG